MNDTPCKRILSFGTASGFIVSTNFTKSILVEYLLPKFDIERKNVNNGSLYWNTNRSRPYRTQLNSVDLRGLALFYLKSKDFAYRLCPIFGVVHSILSIWLNYSLKVLYKILSNEDNLDCRIKWPSSQ